MILLIILNNIKYDKLKILNLNKLVWYDLNLIPLHLRQVCPSKIQLN